MDSLGPATSMPRGSTLLQERPGCVKPQGVRSQKSAWRVCCSALSGAGSRRFVFLPNSSCGRAKTFLISEGSRKSCYSLHSQMIISIDTSNDGLLLYN